MKITKEYLKQVIKEEIQKVIEEDVTISSHYDEKIESILAPMKIPEQDKQNLREALYVLISAHEKGVTADIAGVVRQAEKEGMLISPEVLRRVFNNVVSAGSAPITRPNINRQKLAPAPAPAAPPK